MASSPRAFVLRHTRLRPVPGLEEIDLHLADDVLDVWGSLQVETGDPETAMPYWAVAWGGGLAVGRYLRDHQELVAGGRVFDLGSGSGLCAIAAVRAGAQHVVANDIDPFAAAAIALNARANRCRVDVVRRDALDEEPPDVDVILAAECWYNAELAGRVLPWLRRAEAAGIDVLVGDPGRDHLPRQALVGVATYDVRTTSDLEDLRLTHGHVYRLGGT
jgi:predicted nicotinamide N-methyase